MEIDDRELLSLIYESTVNPAGYDALIDAWNGLLEQGPLTLDDNSPAARRLSAVGGHLRRAEDILDHIGRTSEARRDDTSGDRIDFTIGGDGRIFAANAAAIALLGSDPAIGDLLDRCDADSVARLRKAMRKISDLREGQFATLITLPGDEAKARSAIFLALFGKVQHSGRRRVLRVKSLQVGWSSRLEEAVIQTFGLSPAETELCRLLMQGQSVSEAAKTKGRSVETAKVQLKSVFRKTYSKSQSDLMRTILVFSSFIERSLAAVGDEGGRRKTKTVVLKGGRAVPVVFFGDENGRPVIFLHGMMDGLAGPSLMNAELTRAGLKLICPVRPGFGDASAIELHGQAAKQQVAHDVMAVADEFMLERFAIVGHLAGAAYAYTAAEFAGSRATYLLNVSGAVPIRSINQIRAMSFRQKVVALTAKFRPQYLAPLLRIGVSQIDSREYPRFLNALFQDGTPDRACIEQHGLRDTLEKHYRWSVKEGYHGFRLDASVVTTNWFRGCETPSCPTLLMHGVYDPVVRYESARKFSREIPNAQLRTFDDAGQLLIYQHCDEIVSALGVHA